MVLREKKNKTKKYFKRIRYILQRERWGERISGVCLAYSRNEEKLCTAGTFPSGSDRWRLLEGKK